MRVRGPQVAADRGQRHRIRFGHLRVDGLAQPAFELLQRVGGAGRFVEFGALVALAQGGQVVVGRAHAAIVAQAQAEILAMHEPASADAHAALPHRDRAGLRAAASASWLPAARARSCSAGWAAAPCWATHSLPCAQWPAWHLEDAGHPGMGDSIAAAVRANARFGHGLADPAGRPAAGAPRPLLAVAHALDGAGQWGAGQCSRGSGRARASGRLFDRKRGHLAGLSGPRARRRCCVH